MAGYEVLIIDDDPAQHLIIGEYLRLAGYEVTSAENGEQGLKMLGEHIPDLILLDVQMPGLDGFQVIQKIRENAANQNISVLFLTALDRQNLKIKGLELGADDFITKPCDRAELLARINAVLRRSGRTRSLEGVMEGNLTDVGISDLLQSMELSMKTATIRIKDLDAEIVIKNGELLHVRKGAFKDYQALLRIFLLERGYFSTQFNEIPAGITPGKPQSLTSVLMNVANDVDEIKDLLRQIGIGDRRLKFADDLSDFPALEKVRDVTPATFTELIVEMEDDPKKNIKILVAASKQRKLKIEKK